MATRQIRLATMLGLFTLLLENIGALSNIVTQSMIFLEMKTFITNNLTSMHESFNIVSRICHSFLTFIKNDWQ